MESKKGAAGETAVPFVVLREFPGGLKTGTGRTGTTAAGEG